ncbi:MAG: ABC transporter permease [Pseudomonadota bacterium]|nr:ABC transporter permease [Pseudomonadota bacterium]
MNRELQRKLDTFWFNKQARISLLLFILLYIISLMSNIIANEKPLIVNYKGQYYFPIVKNYPATTFGGKLKSYTDYKSPHIIKKINQHGWMIMPIIPYSYNTHDFQSNQAQPASPSWRHILGTDDQGRDILARTLYALRINISFGIILTACSLIIGVSVGAIQGYFGGLVDLIGQRIIEIFSGMPTLYLLIILTSFIQPSFLNLLGVLLIFGWIKFVGVVRAEFLRARNLDYVLAAKTLGVSDKTIIFRHILPNALVATITYLPWNIIGGIMALTSLDFLGFGMPIGSASLGEMMSQAKMNLHAPWIGISVFIVMFMLLSFLVFIGEGLRDAFDPHGRNQ